MMTFHNIFSSKKETNEDKEKTKIIIDNRERNSLVPSELVKLGFEIEFKQLPVADYLINNIAIERKTLSDLQSSIINKRIFQQLTELKQYEKCFLLIEGYNGNAEPIISENAIKGFILACSLDYKIPIILTENERDSALYISILSKKKNDKEISINPKKISLNKEEQLQYILEGFPNIGPVKAKALIKKFKTLKNIINAPALELEDILGKRTKDFVELSN
jgi:ERCC4-type nuclease